MSMIIGNGVRFHAASFQELYQDLADWRAQLFKLTLEKVATIFAQDATQKIDDAMAIGEPPPSHALQGAYARFIAENEKIKQTGVRNPRFDLDFEISVFSYNDLILGIIRSEHKEWIKEFKKIVKTSSFEYWDNTDKPSNVSRPEWDSRKIVWNNIFGSRISNFGTNSLESICTIPNHLWWSNMRRSDVIKQIAPYEDRLKRVASNTVRQRQMAVFLNLDETDLKEKHTTEITRSFFDAEKWIKTDAGQTMLGIEMAHLRNLLLPKITEDML
jgi:hypothetical protein